MSIIYFFGVLETFQISIISNQSRSHYQTSDSSIAEVVVHVAEMEDLFSVKSNENSIDKL